MLTRRNSALSVVSTAAEGLIWGRPAQPPAPMANTLARQASHQGLAGPQPCVCTCEHTHPTHMASRGGWIRAMPSLCIPVPSALSLSPLLYWATHAHWEGPAQMSPRLEATFLAPDGQSLPALGPLSLAHCSG